MFFLTFFGVKRIIYKTVTKLNKMENFKMKWIPIIENYSSPTMQTDFLSKEKVLIYSHSQFYLPVYDIDKYIKFTKKWSYLHLLVLEDTFHVCTCYVSRFVWGTIEHGDCWENNSDCTVLLFNWETVLMAFSRAYLHSGK